MTKIGAFVAEQAWFDRCLGSSLLFEKFANKSSFDEVVKILGPLSEGDVYHLGMALHDMESQAEFDAVSVNMVSLRKVSELAKELHQALKALPTFEGLYFFDDDVRCEQTDLELADEDRHEAFDITALNEQLLRLASANDLMRRKFEAARELAVAPARNTSLVQKERHYYWLILAGFWRHCLGRSIARSTINGKAGGPLVGFISAMSPGISKDSIAAWLRDHGDKSLKTLPYFRTLVEDRKDFEQTFALLKAIGMAK